MIFVDHEDFIHENFFTKCMACMYVDEELGLTIHKIWKDSWKVYHENFKPWKFGAICITSLHAIACYTSNMIDEITIVTWQFAIISGITKWHVVLFKGAC